jgi:glycerol-3-phosphate O-acyltransferase
MSLAAVPEPSRPFPDPAGRPVCFLVDASSSVEERVIERWLAEHRPVGVPSSVVRLPGSRRRRAGDGATAIAGVLDRPDDPMLIPVRVAWMSPVGRKRRVPRLIDLITLGDPRDPNRLLQEIIIWLRPDRARVMTGEPATVSQLRERFGDGTDREFAEFAYLQGVLALEVAERRMRGNRYKVPRFLAEDLLASSGFRAGLAEIAGETGEDPDAVEAQAARYLKEIAATPSTFVLDLVAALIRIVYTLGYHHRIQYDADVLERVAAIGREQPMAFVPSHKSNMDHLALTYVLYENGLPPNHAAGGINMNFFPVGPLLRRHGIFFIRRSFKDNPTYKYVLKSYIGYLLAKRFPLEWYMEGGRSRSGKLRAPRFGMLTYVVDAWRNGACDDVVLIPTSIAYDQIQDVGAHADEQRGKAKERESFGWMLRVLNSLRRRYGRIYLNFGEPISLAETLRREQVDQRSEETPLDVAKLGFEVMVRINRATPITPISLVALALLGASDRAVTVAETHAALRAYVDVVERRGLPVTEPIQLDDPAAVAAALDALVEHGVVTRYDKGPEPVYAIGVDQHLAAAFYRNTIIHWFTTGAIVELALIEASRSNGIADAAFDEAARRLRDLLKFEFFFAGRDEFADEVRAEVEFQAPGRGPLRSSADAEAVLRARSPLTAHWVMRPIFEAYLLVAEDLVDRDYRHAVTKEDLVASCLARGAQYTLQRRIRSPEAVSSAIFESAIELAANRGLLAGGDTYQLECRQRFADEIRTLVAAIDEIEKVASGVANRE